MSKERVDDREGFTHEDWLEMCAFVERDVFGYDENMKLPNAFYLRLRGLSRGQFLANNSRERRSEYSYKVMLYTFKYCLLDIKRALSTKSFKNEQNKVNYVMVIIENNINDVYLKMKKNEESSVKAEELDLKDNYAPQHYYKGDDKKESKISNLLNEDIW